MSCRGVSCHHHLVDGPGGPVVCEVVGALVDEDVCRALEHHHLLAPRGVVLDVRHLVHAHLPLGGGGQRNVVHLGVLAAVLLDVHARALADHGAEETIQTQLRAAVVVRYQSVNSHQSIVISQ